MPQIVTVGETMAAFTPGSTGFLRYVKNYEMRIAGAESNLAIGVSKLGHSAGWISCLGKDEFGNLSKTAYGQREWTPAGSCLTLSTGQASCSNR